MPSTVSANERHDAYEALGIRDSDLRAIEGLASHQEAHDAMQRLRSRAQKVYKRLALELHPDRNGGDEAKTRFFDVLTQVLSEISKAVPKASAKAQFHVSCSPMTSRAAPIAFAVNQRPARRATAPTARERALRLAKMMP